MSRAERLWALTRSVVTYTLGVLVIVDSLTEKETASVGKLIVGLLLLGVPPIDDLIRLAKRGRRDPGEERGGRDAAQEGQ